MAKKIILIILIIGCLSINANAYILTTYYNPSNYLIGYMDNSYGGESDDPDAPVADGYTYYLAAYFNDNSNRVSPQIPTGYEYVPVIMMWNSYFNFNTIYKFTIDIEFEGLVSELQTGIVGTGRLAIMPADLFTGIIPENVGAMQVVTAPNLSEYELIGAYPDFTPYYHMFYDATSKKLSCIFMFPDWWSHSNFNNYIVLDLGSTFGSAMYSSTVELVEYTGLQVKDNYTDILEQIRDRLDGISGGGGGLTEEQINQAIQDALTAHEQQLEQEVSGKLDQILEQISGVTEPYKQAVDQITGTLANVSNIFAYAGTDAVLTLPAAVNPLAGNAVLWQAQQIDLGAAYNTLPSSLRTLLQYALRAAVLLAVLHEVINIIKYAIIGRGDKVD